MTLPIVPPTVNALPPAPLPTDTPLDFDTKAFASVQAQTNLPGEINATAAATYQNAVASDERAVSANADAGTATTQAGVATTQAGLATTAANTAQSRWNDFDAKYLGTKSSNPTLDNNGNPLTVGAFYFNSVANTLRVWDGTVWQVGIIPTGGYVIGPVGSTDGNVVIFDGTSGGTIKDTGIASANLQMKLAIVQVSGTAQLGVSGNRYILNNIAASTLTLPAAPVDGDIISVISGNARKDNVIGFNGNSLCGKLENMTIDVPYFPLNFHFDTTNGWRLI